MSEISIGNIYDINKQAMIFEKPLKNFEIEDKMREIKSFLNNCNDKYYMLLCRERYDFTIFAFNNYKRKEDLDNGSKDLQECLENRGIIYSIDLTESKNAYEIWLKIDNKFYIYYLFPYDQGVLEERS